MVVLFISRPLEFQRLPDRAADRDRSCRLSLNLASTRLILAHGHEGNRTRPGM